MDFARCVCSAVKQIPKGKVCTYKDIAKAVGKPGAWRAVGNVLNKNKDATIPCHRVVRSNLSIGGYSKGTRLKASKLKAEGVVIVGGKVRREFLFTFSSP